MLSPADPTSHWDLLMHQRKDLKLLALHFESLAFAALGLVVLAKGCYAAFLARGLLPVILADGCPATLLAPCTLHCDLLLPCSHVRSAVLFVLRPPPTVLADRSPSAVLVLRSQPTMLTFLIPFHPRWLYSIFYIPIFYNPFSIKVLPSFVPL